MGIDRLSAREQVELIKRTAVEIIPEDELWELLDESKKTGVPLKVKLGCDPSRPDLHLGHTVPLRQLRLFQDMGHTAVLVVGDFTAMIGDPSGRNQTRPALTFEETRRNGETYFKQASIILDPERTQIVYNSEWLEPMRFQDVIALAAKYTVARMLERNDFEQRYRFGVPIGVHEFLYPLAQAYDSVALQADIELGGTDQKFNLLVGRDIQREYGQRPQVVITFPLLEGLDGTEKMSKSLDNYIGITDPPREMFGKAMSIPDKLIVKYFRLLTNISDDELAKIEHSIESGANPRDTKLYLAWKLVEMYHSSYEADEARDQFIKVFSQRKLPDDIPVVVRPRGSEVVLFELIADEGLASSRSEARRLIKQGAVSVNGDKIKDEFATITPENEIVMKVGKRRYLKVIPE